MRTRPCKALPIAACQNKLEARTGTHRGRFALVPWLLAPLLRRIRYNENRIRHGLSTKVRPSSGIVSRRTRMNLRLTFLASALLGASALAAPDGAMAQHAADMEKGLA